jgi:hypothetical protein
MVGGAPHVCDVFVVDENLGDGELGNGGHAALLLLLHGTAEAPGPVESVEESDYDVAADSFFDPL